MAKGKKTGGRDWQPGVSANPAGRTPLPAVLKDARRLNKTAFEEVVNKYLWAPQGELEEAIKDKSLATVEAWMVAIMLKGRTTGNWDGYEWIAQRIMGKVKEQVEVTQPKPFVVHHRDGSQMVLGAAIEEKE